MKFALKVAVFSLGLGFLSTTASAFVVDLGDRQDNIELGYESLGGAQDKQQQLDELIEKNPELGAQRLVRYFSESGDLEAVRYLAPRLLEKLPGNGDLQALYALSLANSNNLSEAKKQAGSARAKKSAYYDLVQAMILKAEHKLDNALKHAKMAQSANPDLAYSYNLLGNIYSEQGKYKLALKQFEKARQLAPGFIAAHSNVGATQYLLGENRLAAAAFASAIRQAPKACKPHYGRAIVAESLRLYRDAIADLEFCLDDDQLSISAHEKAATLSLEIKQLAQALKYSGAIKLVEPRFHNLIQGEVALRENRVKDSIRFLKQADQKNPRTQLILALAYALDGDFANALETAKQSNKRGNQLAYDVLIMAIEVAKEGSANTPMTAKLANSEAARPYVEFLRGVALAAEGKTDTALSSLEGAEGFFQGFSVEGVRADELSGVRQKELPGLALGTYLYMADMPTAAASQFEQVVKVNPNSLFGSYLLALAEYGEYKSKVAVERLSTVLKQAPNFFAANYMMGEALVSLQQNQDAVQYYDKAASIKKDAGVLVKLGLLNEHIGQLAGAEAAYKRLVNEFPDFYVGYNQLAWLYAKSGNNLDEGIRLAKKANSLQKDNIGVIDTLGWLHYHKKEFKTAARYLEKANQLGGSQKPDVLYHLAAVQNAMGKKAEAKANLKKAFSLASYFDGHEEAKQLLSSISE